MRLNVSRPDFGVLADVEDDLAEDLTVAMRIVATGMKGDLREQVTSAGLGNRLANTWRGDAYPRGRNSLEPAAFVYSKAPKLIDAYDRGATILPTDGRRYLAIPTKHVPLKGRGRTMTPVEVEAAFNEELFVRNGRAGRKLLFINAVQAKSARRPGLRQATARRIEAGRKVKLLLMFVLVPQVHVRKRLDVDAVARRWTERFPEILAAQGRRN